MEKSILVYNKDSSTNEILAHYVSDNLRLDIVLNTLEKLKSNVNLKLHNENYFTLRSRCSLHES